MCGWNFVNFGLSPFFFNGDELEFQYRDLEAQVFKNAGLPYVFLQKSTMIETAMAVSSH